MKKAWKIVGILVLVIIVLGAICVGVGLLTGGDSSRIYSVLDNRYNLKELYRVYAEYIAQWKLALVQAGL
jgi:hypothetical protein